MFTKKVCISQILLNQPMNLFSMMVSIIYEKMEITTSKGTNKKIKINETMKPKNY